MCADSRTERPLQKPGQHPAVDELERRLAGTVVSAAQDGDFVRHLALPEQMRWASTVLLWLAVITIIFSASSAFAQRDLKRILAYSSINHLGYCLLAVFAVTDLKATASASAAGAKCAKADNGLGQIREGV